MRMLRQSPDFQRALTNCDDEWQQDSLIHGDIKFTNCIVFPQSGGTLGFRIVDWELADWGDAAWDVGGVFRRTWISGSSRCRSISGAPDQIAAQAEIPCGIDATGDTRILEHVRGDSRPCGCRGRSAARAVPAFCRRPG